MSNPTVTLTGRIGQDPVQLSNGGLRLRVVTNDRAKNQSTGQWEDKDTSWWTVKVWNKLADNSKDVLKKGQEVTITGTIYEENWKDNDGNSKTTYEIKADTVAVTTYSLSKNLVSSNSSWNTEDIEVPF
jgi:single-strand DNA-binding protein